MSDVEFGEAMYTLQRSCGQAAEAWTRLSEAARAAVLTTDDLRETLQRFEDKAPADEPPSA